MPKVDYITEQIASIEAKEQSKIGILSGISRLKNRVVGDSEDTKAMRDGNKSIAMTRDSILGIKNDGNCDGAGND